MVNELWRVDIMGASVMFTNVLELLNVNVFPAEGRMEAVDALQTGVFTKVPVSTFPLKSFAVVPLPSSKR